VYIVSTYLSVNAFPANARGREARLLNDGTDSGKSPAGPDWRRTVLENGMFPE
jgi:hypothetical protein